MNSWFSVSENPPPHNEPVLLWSPPTPGHPNGETEVANYSSGFERNSVGVSNLSIHGSATHWMPLPEPPNLTKICHGSWSQELSNSIHAAYVGKSA